MTLIHILNANAERIPLADGSVQCIATSPPYFGLRDYGIGGQIGLESTPAAYVARLVTVFRECWRVLRDDGVMFVNLGDSYARTGGTDKNISKTAIVGSTRNTLRQMSDRTRNAREINLKPKDLLGIPWRVAFALQDDGWYLRSDIIWAKPNPMPESVTDRPTKSHEYVFLLTKSPRYFWDAAAVAEKANYYGVDKRSGKGNIRYADGKRNGNNGNGQEAFVTVNETRNLRSVWTVATQPYSGAHFATWPEKLVEPMVKAGSRPGDVVLDPFAGSGTTLRVAARLGRRAFGLDLNMKYIQANAKERTATIQMEMPA